MHKKTLLYFADGMIIGSAMLIPGVSGGTTAIILGIYDKMISAVGSFFKMTKKNIIFLASVCFGALIGMALFAKAILFVTDFFRVPMMFLFMGAVLGSLPMLYNKANVKKVSPSVILAPIIGASIVLLIEMIPEDLIKISLGNNVIDYIILILCGVLLSIALVLPGISVSYMLLILGIYEPTLLAIEERNFMFICVLAVGILLGVFLTTNLLEKAMENHSQITYLMIIGFVIVSLREVFPGIPIGIEVISSSLTLISGFGAVLLLSRMVKA